MAKGQAAKQEIMATILSTFADSFMYNGGKEVRINTSENGEPVQIKVVLTAAKTAVSPEDENAMPGAKDSFPEVAASAAQPASKPPMEATATAAEKEAISNLMAELGL